MKSIHLLNNVYACVQYRRLEGDHVLSSVCFRRRFSVSIFFPSFPLSHTVRLNTTSLLESSCLSLCLITSNDLSLLKQKLYQHIFTMQDFYFQGEDFQINHKGGVQCGINFTASRLHQPRLTSLGMLTFPYRPVVSKQSPPSPYGCVVEALGLSLQLCLLSIQRAPKSDNHVSFYH